MKIVQKIVLVLGIGLFALCLFLAYACFVLWLNASDPRNELVAGLVGVVWLSTAGVVFYWVRRADLAIHEEIQRASKLRSRLHYAELDAARQRVRSRNSH